MLDNLGKNILITGGNSGIGFYCVVNLLKNKNFIFVPIKSKQRKDDFLLKLSNYFETNYLTKYLEIINEIDLSDLENIEKVRNFLINKDIKLDILILNAGIQYTGSKYTKVSRQGIELTFAINHLAHFVLTSSLIPLLNNSVGTRIIITSSDVHDPKSPGGNIGYKAGLDDLINFKEEIMGTFINFNADKSYKNSKLCNILFGKELSRKLSLHSKEITVITWAPGLVIPQDDLGFFRYSSKYNKVGYQIFATLAYRIFGVSENVEDAGKLLYEIAIDEDLNHKDYVHLSNRLISYKRHKLIKAEVSEEANNSEIAIKLWKLSEEISYSFGIKVFNV